MLALQDQDPNIQCERESQINGDPCKYWTLSGSDKLQNSQCWVRPDSKLFTYQDPDPDLKLPDQKNLDSDLKLPHQQDLDIQN